jgi:uncharacterized protein
MKIDMHVHLVGTGAAGSGCWYRPKGYTGLGAPFMLRGVGLRGRDLAAEEFDRLYAQRLLTYVRGAGLDAILLLAQELPHRADGTPVEDQASFYVPSSYALKLAAEHPEFLAGVSIHPARPDALEELERCLEGGAVALKCLPNVQGIDWNDRRYTRFLERMAEAKLPLLAHTGSERTMPVMDAKLADPRVLTRALEIGVICIAAHCGTGTIGLDTDYVDVFVEMCARFPNLYGDNSALAALTFRLRPRTLRILTRTPVAERILHGSDVPVPVTGAQAWLCGMMPWRDFRVAGAEENPLARDLLLKKALGFADECVTRPAQVLRLPRRTVDA